MSGTKEFNTNVDLKGKLFIYDVSNANNETVLTYNVSTKEINQRTYGQILSDLDLPTLSGVNTFTGVNSFYTLTVLDGTANDFKIIGVNDDVFYTKKVGFNTNPIFQIGGSFIKNSTGLQYNFPSQSGTLALMSDVANASHTHSNLSVLNGISSTKVSNWDIGYNDSITGITFTNTTLTLNQQDGGNVVVSVPTFNQNTTGTAASLTTTRSITITGDASWTVNFKGNSNVSGILTLSNSGVTAGTYRSVTVDSKGRVTNGTNPTTLAGYGITDAINTSATAQTKTGDLTVASIIKSGGTGTQILMANGSVLDSTTLVTNATLTSDYVTINTPQTISGQKTFTPQINTNGGINNLGLIEMNTQAAIGGISWFLPSYTSWIDYMGPSGVNGGPKNITAPSGTLVTNWARRSFIENIVGYGWTFESGTSTSTTPSIVAEISSVDGAAKFGGQVTGASFKTGTLKIGYNAGAYNGFDSPTPIGILNGSNGQSLYAAGILSSDAYDDASNIPPYGIYSKGQVLTNTGFKVVGGTNTGFLMADGTINTNTYVNSSTGLNGYLPLTGGTMTGSLSLDMNSSHLKFKVGTVDKYHLETLSDNSFNIVRTGDLNRFKIGSDGVTTITTDSGHISLGPMNSSYSHIYSNLPFYFNQELMVNGALVWNSNNDGHTSGLDADLWDNRHFPTIENWDSDTRRDLVAGGGIGWRNNSNAHSIIDMSSALTPNGVSKSNINPDLTWDSGYPTLMGYDGTNTYGVRVDTATNAEQLGGTPAIGYMPKTGGTFTGDVWFNTWLRFRDTTTGNTAIVMTNAGQNTVFAINTPANGGESMKVLHFLPNTPANPNPVYKPVVQFPNQLTQFRIGFYGDTYPGYMFAVKGLSMFESKIETTSHGNSEQWNQAFTWGDHASAGYLTSASLSGYATESWVSSGYQPLNSVLTRFGTDIVSAGPTGSGLVRKIVGPPGSTWFVLDTNTYLTQADLAGYVTTNTPQTITGFKEFQATGNIYYQTSLQVKGNGSTVYPGIGFHQPGVVGNQLNMTNDGWFNFVNGSNGDYAGLRVREFETYGHIINKNGAFKSNSIIGFFTEGNNAQNINVGGLLVSNDYSDLPLVPANGIYSKGDIKTSGDINLKAVGSDHRDIVWLNSDNTEKHRIWEGSHGATTLSYRNSVGTEHALIHSGNMNAFTASQRYFQSTRDFPNGTLIYTDIDYSQTNGDAWLLEIKGNSYSGSTPMDIKIQGYIYYDTIIHVGGTSNHQLFTTIKAMNIAGKLCFWFPSQGYWIGYDVFCSTTMGYGTTSINRVTNVVNSGIPGGTKVVDISLTQMATQNWVTSQNYLTSSDLVHKFDYSFSQNNASDSHTNKSWFDYNWAGEGYAGSVINFSGLNGNYSTELFASYSYQDSIGIRSRNGDTNTWNPVKWLWHSGNFNPSNYYTKTESLGLFVGLTGVQTIADTKTFTASPIVPNGTLGNHAVNLNQLDGKENAFAKNTAFNKNFGTTAGTVAEGNHTHSGYLNQSLNIDVSAESNNLRINPIEIFIDGSSKEFDGSIYPHRLVYIILSDGATGLDLVNLQPKQRIVIFNSSGLTINIREDVSSSAYSLYHGYKVSVYKIQNSYYSANSAIFYDMTELAIW